MTCVDFRVAHVNAATAALTYLLIILGIATWFGLRESITASVASMLAYNFFFLPPIGTFTIADPQNWVALSVFLLTAITASQLSSNARRKAEEARSRQDDLQRLYEFSRALMLGDNERSLAAQAVRQFAFLFGTEEVCVYDAAADSVSKIADRASVLTEADLRRVASQGHVWRNPDASAVILPIALGGAPLGSFGVMPADHISELVLHAVAQLIAIAFERARAQQTATRMEAERQNEQLKSTLLDALAHEFKTPLTSMKAATSTMLARRKLDPTDYELATVLDEETDRMTNLVGDAIELARIGSEPVALHRTDFSPAQLISNAIAGLRPMFQGRDLNVSVPEDLPSVNVDRKLVELALRQLLTNAIKYSPPNSPISVTANKEQNSVVLQIASSGPGIPVSEQQWLFEKFYRGRDARRSIPGTGMGLSITRDIVTAHGGRIWVESELGHGAQFCFTLPVVPAGSTVKPKVAQTVA